MKSVNNIQYPQISSFREVIMTSLSRPYDVTLAFVFPYNEAGYTRRYIRKLVHEDIEHVNRFGFAPNENLYFKVEVSVAKDLRSGTAKLTCYDRPEELTLKYKQQKYRYYHNQQVTKLRKKADKEREEAVLNDIRKHFLVARELLIEMLFDDNLILKRGETIALPITTEDPNYKRYRTDKMYRQMLRKYWNELCNTSKAVGCVDMTNLICYVKFNK